MPEESQAPATPQAEPAKPAAKAAPAKPPALETKPFSEFIEEHYLPALRKALVDFGAADAIVQFLKAPIAVQGVPGGGLCAQVVGHWSDREFRIYFPKEDISGTKAFSYTEKGAPASTLEPFLIDERKITLDLLISAAILRLQAQKWLGRN